MYLFVSLSKCLSIVAFSFLSSYELSVTILHDWSCFCICLLNPLFPCLQGYQGEAGPQGKRGPKGNKVRFNIHHTHRFFLQKKRDDTCDSNIPIFALNREIKESEALLGFLAT